MCCGAVSTCPEQLFNSSLICIVSQDVVVVTNHQHKFRKIMSRVCCFPFPRCNVRGEDRRVLGLELDREHHALFVAFSSCVVRVPLSRCSDYGSCKE